MALDQVANFVRGNTDAAVDSTQTTISVVDASIFSDPANGEYNLVLWDAENYPRPDQDPDVEIVRVTGRDTTNDDLTVTRGQETTTGASHPSGSALQLSPTAKMFGDIAPADQAVEDFTTNSTTSGEVPTSQGDGTLAMGAVSAENLFGWVEDANSPFSSTGSSITATLADDYSHVKVVMGVSDNDNVTEKISLQINGQTSGYDVTYLDATTGSGLSDWPLMNLTGYEFNYAILSLSGRWAENANIQINQSVDFSNGAVADMDGILFGMNRHVGQGSYLNELKFIRANSASTDFQIKVYGIPWYAP